ncbi:MAG: hypothetical protein K2Q10_02965, partial [Rhodospirillales bacterium]|nr:hypothetical protein [Rhodospirillales bacterium]
KKRLALTEPGRALLEKRRPGLDDNAVRLLHWLVRRGKPAKSSQIPATIGSAAEVATWLDALSGQGLILRKVKPATTTPVRLTSRGNEVLAKLAEELALLRGGEKAVSPPERSAQPEPEPKPEPEPASDDRILATIGDLDRQHNSGNYLPIFHLRESFPDLAREDLDSALMRLSRGKKISLSSLQESRDYTPNQVDSGIPQRLGGPLFFIRLR